ASYTLIGLAANRQPPNKTTDAVVYYLLVRQVADGRWRIPTNPPPLGSSDLTVTANAVRALQLYAPRGLRQEVDRRIERARAWLLKAVPGSNEEENFQLLRLAWGSAERPALEKAAQALLARQRRDGGWGQEPMLASD